MAGSSHILGLWRGANVLRMEAACHAAKQAPEASGFIVDLTKRLSRLEQVLTAQKSLKSGVAAAEGGADLQPDWTAGGVSDECFCRAEGLLVFKPLFQSHYTKQ